ncbi:CinA family protein [Nocardioides dongxiaopingii]|uniref:CinA family protein n=1 Tax=Nocardioides sp. S-1144 TaxID=2582905 RepID=UPI00110EF6B2|nr:CinA family protein [Nocardioides sp. S-1144]QCW51073.1 CinA family protein [Nocardioides sp. S-1144]
MNALPERVHDLLREGGSTLATAESLTGGRLAALLTAVPGASAAYRGGVVAYASDVKTSVLGVPQEVVDRVGVVSAECAAAMAEGVRRLTGATYGVATTGVAGPTEQEGKAPGTVFVAVAGPGGGPTLALELPGDRARVVERTCEEALEAVLSLLGSTGLR